MEYYIGIDIGKENLDVHIDNNYFRVKNSKKGYNTIKTKLLNYIDKKHIIKLIVCEASGGYERRLVNYLRWNNFPVHVAHANKVRAFAKAKGLLAKSDKIDARVISLYAKVMDLKDKSIPFSETAQQIKDWIRRREQLLEDRIDEQKRLDKIINNDIKNSIKQHINWLEHKITKINEKLEQLSYEEPVKETVDLLMSVPGVGRLTALNIIAYLPEIGQCSHRALGALVGVVPYNRDSGSFHGRRFIQGGRKILRHALYMSAVAAIKWNKDLKQFYLGLKARGKESKVALVAVIRKLLIILNNIIKRGSPWIEKPQNV